MAGYAPPDHVIEESSDGLPPIVGVATSTCGFVGLARSGPFEGVPSPITSFAAFRHCFGDEGPIVIDGVECPNYLALAVRSFFDNGGRRAVVARVRSAPGDAEPTVDDFVGGGAGDTATGLAAIAEVEEVAVVTAPGSQALSGNTPGAVRDALIDHCERLRSRFALISAPASLDVGEIRTVRSTLDTHFAALYYPWCDIADPAGDGREGILVPPDGFVAGVLARNDIERGVQKSAAGLFLRGVRRLARALDDADLGVLRSAGINVLHMNAGRGFRVSGDRTLTSEPEWSYVGVRRLLIFLERSIARGLEWAVFEPNEEPLWRRVRRTVENFLSIVWRNGALMGATPRDAFFVRCERTTMTRAEIDDGRLVLVYGVAPIRPAEFVVVRIVQQTAGTPID